MATKSPALALTLAALLWSAGSASAEEIRVIASGGFTAAYLELVPGFERATGHRVVTTFGGSMGNGPETIPNRLQRGEAADIVILAASALDDLIQQGKVVPGSRVDLARSSIGMAVRAGAPRPDISSVAALTAALLGAKSIAYSASASGVYLSTEMFQRLGVADRVLPKSKNAQGERVGALIARGEAEIGFQQISELLAEPGIDYVGPLPADVQRVTVFAAGIVAGSMHREEANALIAFLASPDALPVITKTGLEPLQAPPTGAGQERTGAAAGTPRDTDVRRPALDYEAVRATKVVRAVRITDRITIDGSLDEPAWKLARPAVDFYQYAPNPGELSPEPTEVRFLYDADNLYVGFHSWDSDMAHRTVTELGEDFSPTNSDVATIVIDSLHDRQSGYQFATNAAGARRDSQISNDGVYNNDWDAVWDVKVSVQEDGWIAEFIIPFKTFRFSNAPTQEWGLNLGRKILRRNEDNQWAPIPVRFRAISKISLAGTLIGLDNIRPGRNLKIKPYVSTGSTQVRTDAALPMRALQSLGKLKDYDTGVDLKYGVGPSLTLDATVHTDFAQVEVDQQQVNLTRFSLFFPEKRDFFIENAGNFGFGGGGGGAGRSSSGGGSSIAAGGNMSPFYSRRIGLSAAGTPIPILGGTRLSGKIGGYDVGVLAMKTDRLVVRDAAGEVVSTTPSNNYVVSRVRRNLLRNSFLGVLMTSRDSNTSGDYNRVYGADAFFELDKWQFTSYILRSDTPGQSGEDQARRLGAAWQDDELYLSTEYNAVQGNFNPEVGFLRRANFSQYTGDIAWRPQLRRSQTIRNLDFGASVDYYEDAVGGTIETRVEDVNVGIQLENNGSINYTAIQTFDRLAEDTRILRAVVPAGDYRYLAHTASFSTNQSRRIAGSGNFGWGDFWNGSRRSVTGALGVTPNYHLSVDMTYSRNDVELPSGAFTTDLVGLRTVYAFTGRASLNAFFQYNTDSRRLSSNIRFNFIHRPLSDLYIVYNDSRDSTSGRSMERSFTIKLTNLFDF